jgi:hypothetical protein
MSSRTSSHVSPALPLLLGSLLALAGCRSASAGAQAAPAGSSVQLADEFTATATVAAIEHDTRLVTLRREDGGLMALRVGDAARNFDQLVVGDRVRARYRESLTATKLGAGAAARSAEIALGAGRTEAGAKPGGGIGVGLSARVTLESIDVEHDVVVFSLASGELVAHRLATDEGRSFVRGLRVVDVVQLDYAEALALTVEEL